jgi:hypothetical protein
MMPPMVSGGARLYVMLIFHTIELLRYYLVSHLPRSAAREKTASKFCQI